jgi:hypothetical protein
MQAGDFAAPGSDNPYEAPQARIAEPVAAVDASFYVVSPTKFLILAISTLGLYQVYWFYKNWALLNVRHKNYWPPVRAIFAIFFTHSLFSEVDEQRRRRGIAHEWSPVLLATAFVIAAIAGQVFDRLAAMPRAPTWFAFAGLAMFPVQVATLYRAQLAINAVEGDVGGTRNDRLTIPNYLWLTFGVLLWTLIVAGFLLPEPPPG